MMMTFPGSTPKLFLLPSINCQLSTVNCQLSTVNCQLSNATNRSTKPPSKRRINHPATPQDRC
ncbi:MAG: hypothetical protein JGK29_17765 [Microcoleus sp. PH2017_17_BER_D_A]|nr:hypothetical protein [Microcoleus sp. PH2017_17_BER_D_A]